MITSNRPSGASPLTGINQNQHDSNKNAFPPKGLLQRFTERVSSFFKTTDSEPEDSFMDRIRKLGLGAYLIGIGAALATCTGPIGIGFGIALILMGVYCVKRSADIYAPPQNTDNLPVDPDDL